MTQPVDVLEATFLRSLPRWNHEGLDPLPEICFAGRSNVGKSSLLNCLAGRKALARTSKTPGRTQALNVFKVVLRRSGEQRALHFVDLPGYGYAKAPKSVRNAWGPMMESYLRGNKLLRTAVLLFDIRHPPTGQDAQLVDLLADCRVALIPVATKSDKIGRTQRAKHIKAISGRLQIPPAIIRPFSSVDREGREALLEDIFELAQPSSSCS